MAITETEALQILPLLTMRAELRIPDDSHDDLVTGQIVAAMNFISELTGRGYSDLGNPALRSAAILLVRQLYNGYNEIKPNAAFYALIDPYRNLAGKFAASPRVIVDPTTSDHARFFGWSDDRLIEAADFSGAATSDSNVGILPARSTNGYLWFGVPVAAGYPASLHINSGPINQLAVFVQQAGTVDDSNGQPHFVGVSFDIQSFVLADEQIELGY